MIKVNYCKLKLEFWTSYASIFEVSALRKHIIQKKKMIRATSMYRISKNKWEKIEINYRKLEKKIEKQIENISYVHV